jgi:hypothetical protein
MDAPDAEVHSANVRSNGGRVPYRMGGGCDRFLLVKTTAGSPNATPPAWAHLTRGAPDRGHKRKKSPATLGRAAGRVSSFGEVGDLFRV